MSKGKKTGGRNFPIGNKFGGRKKLPEEIKELRKESKDIILKAIIHIENILEKELETIDESNLTLLEKAILNSYLRNDYSAIQYWHNRVHGRPTESHRFVDEEGNDTGLTINISESFIPKK